MSCFLLPLTPIPTGMLHAPPTLTTASSEMLGPAILAEQGRIEDVGITLLLEGYCRQEILGGGLRGVYRGNANEVCSGHQRLQSSWLR